MKHLRVLCILVLLVLTQSACNLPTAQPSPVASPIPIASATSAGTPLPLPTDTPQAAETPAPSQINLDLLKNFTYWIEDFSVQVALKDGVFSNGEITSQLIEPVGFGDLNGDGQTDAAVVLTVDPSGSGTFFYLTTVLDQNGTPVQAGFSSIGDRQGINNVEIANSRVVLDYVTQGLSDPLCCPSEHRLRSYLLENGALHLASEQVLDSPTAQATPLPNAILIDQPVMIATLTSPQQVSGKVSQVPPEKKLAYYVTDLNATLLMQGEVPLEGEPGGPGTFAFEFDLGTLPPGLVQIEVVDSANGILRGRSIVVLLTQRN